MMKYHRFVRNFVSKQSIYNESLFLENLKRNKEEHFALLCIKIDFMSLVLSNFLIKLRSF